MIISPHFPPVNAPDMQRVRMSLPYYRSLGWEPVVIAVNPEFVDGYLEEALVNTFPSDIEVHRVNAWPIKKTSKFGLGSLSIRSFFQILKKGNELLRKDKFDLVFFSTSTFHVCRLGPYWKKKYNIPFVVDMQDPWRNDFYLDKPKAERPPKFKYAYWLDKKLEAATIPRAAGIMSVSNGYIETLMGRYPVLKRQNTLLLPFCASENDHLVAAQLYPNGSGLIHKNEEIHLVYAGRGGNDLRKALEIIFSSVSKLRQDHPQLVSKFKFTFVGTSYAAAGKGSQTILPIATIFGLEQQVHEMTERIPFLMTLSLLQEADVLIVPGSTDIAYTASKIYPYILAGKPLLAVFNQKSSVVGLLRGLNFGEVIDFQNDQPVSQYQTECAEKLLKLVLSNKDNRTSLNKALFRPFMAEYNAQQQVCFFEMLLNEKRNKSN